MRRVARLIVPVSLAVFALPGQAQAAERYSSASFGVHIGISLLGLLVSVALLVEALGLRKVALGGLIADKMSFVVLAVVCLAASALAEWGTNFVVDLTLEQFRLASEVLVVVAMALLAAYFWSVRTGMSRFIRESGAVSADSITSATAERDNRG